MTSYYAPPDLLNRIQAALESAGINPEQLTYRDLLAIDQVFCSPLPLGRGMVRTAHGLLPLPAPAALELLKRRWVPVYGVETELELVTPTGAALATTLAVSFGSPPPMGAVVAVGYGAGKADPGYPNYLRVFLGRNQTADAAYEEPVQVIEVNIDDLNPEIYGYLMEKLLHEGALDVYFSPVQMKKNRPAVKVSVLAPVHKFDLLLQTVFQETSTLGVRVFQGRKIMRPRTVESVETPWGPVRVKVVPSPDGSLPRQFALEYEDCLAIARRTGLPLKEIYRRVEHLFQLRF